MFDQISIALNTNATPFGLGLFVGLGLVAYWLSMRGQRELWPLVGLIGLFAFNFLFSKNFFALTFREGALFGTTINLLNQGTIVMLLTLGMTLVIAIRGIDLSVGSVMALSGAVCVVLMKHGGLGFVSATLAALAVSAGFGFVNGVLVTRVKVQPIIATLISMVTIRGVAMLLTDGKPISHNDPAFLFVGTGHFLTLPCAVLVVVVVTIAVIWLTRKTALGLFMETVGDNERAAKLAGVPSERITTWLYVASSALAGLAGIMAASYISTADPDRVGRMSELDAISAAVIGGTALSGGRFYLLGGLIGALLIQTLSITMYNQGVPAEIEPMPKAIVILLVCLLLSPESRGQLVALLQKTKLGIARA